jgi:phosphohistidine phosphatase
MRLYLVRHAIAELRDAERWPVDGERPLTARGVRRFRRAARGVATLAPRVERVLSSPFVRAWDTALILKREAGWPAPERCEVLQTSPAAEVMQVVQANRDAASLALVGHEPYLSAFGSYLLTGEESGARLLLRKGAIACFLLADDPDTRAELQWLLQPRALRGLV